MKKSFFLLATSITIITGILLLPQIIIAQIETNKGEEFGLEYSESVRGFIPQISNYDYDSLSNTLTINKTSLGSPAETKKVILNDDEEES